MGASYNWATASEKDLLPGASHLEEDKKTGVPKPLRFLHSSDLHLDCRFVGITDAGLRARRRREHREVVTRIVDLAEEEDVDLLLLVGDLFEESTYQHETISYLVEEFRRLHPRPVFIAPGLCDAFHSDSPYAIFHWGENVTVFEKPTFTSIPLPDLGVTVHGIAPDPDALESNPLRGLRVRQDDSIHLAMAYASNLDRAPEGAERPFPFHEGDVQETGVDYLALGGYHSFQKFGKSPLACYPGMPEGTGFEEAGRKVVVLVEVDEEEVTLRQRSVEGITFVDTEVDIEGVSTVDGVVRKLEEAVGKEEVTKALVRVRLRGSPDPSLSLDPLDLAHRVHLEEGQVEVFDETRIVQDWRQVGDRQNLAGQFARAMQKKIDSKESARHERVRDYGLSALLGKGKLRLRKPPPS